jgi:hypothetical protein
MKKTEEQVLKNSDEKKLSFDKESASFSPWPSLFSCVHYISKGKGFSCLYNNAFTTVINSLSQ